VAALFIFRRREPNSAGYVAPGYPVTPVIFLLQILLLLVLLGSSKPKESILGVAVVALGLPVYYWFFRRQHLTQSSQIDEKRIAS
jgi:APA family basic amino acid/polyamine antiporter